MRRNEYNEKYELSFLFLVIKLIFRTSYVFTFTEEAYNKMTEVTDGYCRIVTANNFETQFIAYEIYYIIII